jgi:GNAT superfamily N-acetyltransferase
MPLAITTRRATAADLPAINAIFYDEETRGALNPPAHSPLPYFAHVLASGETYIAERQRIVIGFASRILRGDVAFLTDLFVRPHEQSSGIGATLLRAALPDDASHRCTYAASDHRALALYARAGMRPRYPQCALLGEVATLRPLPPSTIDVVAAGAGDPELQRWDAELGGRTRPQEFAYWLAECQALPLWLQRDGRTIGYALVQRRSAGFVWHPEAWTIGPLGVRDPADALAGVLAAVAWVRYRAPMFRLFVPGPHPALAPLLDGGLRITYMDAFCSSDSAASLFNPACYIATFDLL